MWGMFRSLKSSGQKSKKMINTVEASLSFWGELNTQPHTFVMMSMFMYSFYRWIQQKSRWFVNIVHIFELEKCPFLMGQNFVITSEYSLASIMVKTSTSRSVTSELSPMHCQFSWQFCLIWIIPLIWIVKNSELVGGCLAQVQVLICRCWELSH